MQRRTKHRDITRNRKRNRNLKIIISICAGILIFLGITAGLIFARKNLKITNLLHLAKSTRIEKPEEILELYVSYIEEKEFGKMYGLLNEESKAKITSEDFIARNENIYSGIEATNLQIEIEEDKNSSEVGVVLSFDMTMNTAAGEINFPDQVIMTEVKEGDYKYLIAWDDSFIFPNLTAEDRVLVSVTEPERGDILDRFGTLLAGKGTASSVGIVPGKLKEDHTEDFNQLAELLNVSVESIEKKISANWVKEDSFVPIKTVSKLTDNESETLDPSEEILQKRQRNEALLSIPGIMITDTQVREYPLGEAASHLIGYIQQVSAEDLEENPDEGYTETSVIGRSGMEALYEKELRGENGCEISIVDSSGTTKIVLATLPKQDGKDIKLTIDAGLQQSLYEKFQEDKSCSVAMNPYTGEVLALVSTPSYNSNDFIFGMSEETWSALNADANLPLYNRFRQKLAPGSSFKPIIAAIGLETGDIDPEEDYGATGLSWQKDASWGNYHITTLHEYEPVILENALIYSDNIYFAKSALKIGIDKLQTELNDLGFNATLPFEISVADSQYSNTENIESEIQLADSGYGQGEVLVNPIHLAALYTGFANEGNVLKPYLLYKQDAILEIWLEGAFQSENAKLVESAMEKVVSSPHGTGYEVYREDIVLAGKTGTAEIKNSQEDTSGTELGWFGVFTADPNAAKPILLMNMVEDVKDRGGSGYVVGKDKEILDQYFSTEK